MFLGWRLTRGRDEDVGRVGAGQVLWIRGEALDDVPREAG